MTVDKDGPVWKSPTVYRSYYNMKIYGYIDLICCVVMIISNALMILVFTKKKKQTPMDTIFIHMALTECLAALAYAPRVWQEFVRATMCSIPQHRTFGWETFSVYGYVTAFLFRSMTVYLAGMLAVWRYVAVLYPLKVRIVCNMKTTRKFVILGYVIGAALALPPYLSIAAGKTQKLLDREGCFTTNFSIGRIETIYEFQLPVENYIFFYNAMFLSYAGLKIGPSVVFAVISYKLIIALFKAKKSREKMTQNSPQNKKTTIILIIIFILFVLGEVPNGFGVLFNVLYGPEYFWRHYFYEMEVFNCLTHISGSLNFVIYYAISDHFRQSFKELFKRKHNNHRNLSNLSNNTTSNTSNTASPNSNFAGSTSGGVVNPSFDRAESESRLQTVRLQMRDLDSIHACTEIVSAK